MVASQQLDPLTQTCQPTNIRYRVLTAQAMELMEKE